MRARLIASVVRFLFSSGVLTTVRISFQLFRINYDGQEIPYRCLQPGGTHRQQTFMTHPWTFKAVTENPEDVVVDDCRVGLRVIHLHTSAGTVGIRCVCVEF